MNKYDHIKIEKKWKKAWDKSGMYKTRENQTVKTGLGTEAKLVQKPKAYILDMFPYPSGTGLHVGHPRGYIATDVYSRLKTMQGYNVLHPMGWDAFGLPAEEYAIKNKIHPSVAVKKNVQRFKEQLSILGLNYDWSREINTTDPEYYRWTQWAFLQMHKKGLTVESHEPINWCPSCKTGLANEDLNTDGTCERCGSVVEKKPIRQWVIKITKYADRLLKDLDTLNWPESIKESQRNWIGRSEATEIDFAIKDHIEKIKIVTTRPDTIFGVTFLAIAPEHTLIEKMSANIENLDEVLAYKNKAVKLAEFERGKVKKDKTGLLLKGITAIHPLTNAKVPVFVADFILPGYGTGAIMSVPGHDDRDFDFAKKFGLPITIVVDRPADQKKYYFYLYDEDNSEVTRELRHISKKEEYMTPTVATYIIDSSRIQDVVSILEKFKIGLSDDLQKIRAGQHFTLEPGNLFSFTQVYSGNGKLINSDFLNGLETKPAITLMHKKLREMNIGGPAVHYRLNDWVFSRQRYWGEPIPLVHCAKCGVVPVPEKELPVKLPNVKSYEPTGTGESPLAGIGSWVNTKCPNCKGPAKRETNTMPQWAGSCWYYLRFIDPKNKSALIDPKKEKYWQPVDMYVGGAEHATRHLIYARFWHKFLFDIGVVSTLEPFIQLKNQGLIGGPDGRKMSKRFGNVVNPDDIVKLYGADTLRVYEMFMGPFDAGIAWSTDNMIGSRRFVEKVWRLAEKMITKPAKGKQATVLKLSDDTESLLQRTIKKVTEDISEFAFNTAISSLMILVNALEKEESVSRKVYETLLKLYAPFAPHSADELWSELGNKKSIHVSAWPSYDENKLVSTSFKIVVQINSKVRAVFTTGTDTEGEVVHQALELAEIQAKLVGKKPTRHFYVKGKLVNFVVEE